VEFNKNNEKVYEILYGKIFSWVKEIYFQFYTIFFGKISFQCRHTCIISRLADNAAGLSPTTSCGAGGVRRGAGLGLGRAKLTYSPARMPPNQSAASATSSHENA